MRRLGIAFGFGLVLLGLVVFAINSPKAHGDPLQTYHVEQEKTL